MIFWIIFLEKIIIRFELGKVKLIKIIKILSIKSKYLFGLHTMVYESLVRGNFSKSTVSRSAMNYAIVEFRDVAQYRHRATKFLRIRLVNFATDDPGRSWLYMLALMV